VDITGSKFEGNTAKTSVGHHIARYGGDVTCKNAGNTFDSPGGNAGDESDGNSPAGLCASTP